MDRLTRIINQLLDWSRLDVGRVDIKPEPLAIDAFVRDVVESFQTLNYRKVHHLGGPTVRMRSRYEPTATSWSRCCGIVGNAIKFTPQSGRVTVQCGTYDEHFAQIIVADTGCGIAADELPLVSTSSLKVESAMPTPRKGRNLGCSLLRVCHAARWTDVGGQSIRRRNPIPCHPSSRNHADYATVGAFLLLSCGASCFAVSDSIMAALFLSGRHCRQSAPAPSARPTETHIQNQHIALRGTDAPTACEAQALRHAVSWRIRFYAGVAPSCTPPFSLSMMIRISENLGDMLLHEGYIVESAASGEEEALHQAKQKRFQAAILTFSCLI